MLKTRAGTMEFIAVLFHLHPRCTGNVRLNSKDPFDYPLIDPNYLCHKDDLKGIIEGNTFLYMRERIEMALFFHTLVACKV